MAKILLYDIESNNLAGNIGICFCISYKWVGEKKIHTLSVLNTGGYDIKKINTSGLITDKYVIKAFSEVMEQADLCVGHYSSKFDHRFINTRLLLHNLPPMANVREFDNWWNAKCNFKFNSNRAETIGVALGVSNKIKLDFTIWQKAGMGHIPSIKYIQKRCETDIMDLEYAYLRMAPFSSIHPRLYDDKRLCPQCGYKSQYRGYRTTLGYKYHRLQCQRPPSNERKCGHWWTGERVK